MILRPLAVVVAVLSLATLASADGLIFKLPADGTSAKFDVKMKIDEPGIEMAGTLEVKSVGRVEKDGEPARWIEVRFEAKDEGGPGFQLYKALVHEKHLKRGGKPFENILELWVQQGDEKATKASGKDDANNGPLPVVMAGPLTGEEKLEAKTIESKAGKLECQGVKGTIEIKGGPEDVSATVETRLHDRAPFGVVQTVFEFTTKHNGEEGTSGTITMTMQEIGMNAKSEIETPK